MLAHIYWEMCFQYLKLKLLWIWIFLRTFANLLFWMMVGEGSFCYCLNRNKIVPEKWLPKNMTIGAAGNCFFFFFFLKACFLHLLRILKGAQVLPIPHNWHNCLWEVPSCCQCACFPSDLCCPVKVGVATQLGISYLCWPKSVWPSWHFPMTPLTSAPSTQPTTSQAGFFL